MVGGARVGMMGEEAVRPRLGRGLAALIGEVGDEIGAVEKARGAARRVPVEFLRRNPRNPRKNFDEAELAALTASIRQRGVVQPIIVRPVAGTPDAFEIVAGERRWRAAQAAGLHEVPVTVVEIDDRTSLEFAIIENVQRADLNPIDEGNGYRQLMEEFGYTQEELAKGLGKSRSHVANTLRLIHLPAPVQDLLTTQRITAGHARALLSCADPVKTAQRILDEDLTVRAVEQIAYADNGNAEEPTPKTRRARRDKDPDTRAVEKALEDVLGLSVAIDHRGEGGELRLRYRSFDQLDALCRRLHETAQR